MNIEHEYPVEGTIVEASFVAPCGIEGQTPKPTIEQSLQRIHRVRDAFREKMAPPSLWIKRNIGASVFTVVGDETVGHAFEIQTVSDGQILDNGKEFTVKFAKGKDLAATLEGLAVIAEQFLEVL